MAGWCKQFDFKSIDDIIALIALYRPGPMDLIPDYIKRKKGQTKIKYAHPLLAEVCADTYGMMIYQEQVMAGGAACWPATRSGGADLLRRAMGKKDKEKMAKEREKFIEGCAALNEIEAKKANEIFDLLEKFAGYGFNKSHSAAYGWISYQTAFLKANCPVEFMAAVLSNEITNTDKISIFVGECQRMGIRDFAAGLESQRAEIRARTGRRNRDSLRPRRDQKRRRRRGAGGDGGTGGARDRSGRSRIFARGSIRRKMNKKVLESLVKCGAFDWTGIERTALFAEIDNAMASAAASHRDRAAGQSSLFGDLVDAAPPPRRTGASFVQPWSSAEKLAFEKELLGFYVTGHPLDPYRPALESGKFHPIGRLVELDDKATVRIAGSLSSVDKKFTKKDGKPFAIVVMEDFTGTVEVMVWNETFTKFAAHLEQGRVVALTGRLDKREEGARIVAAEISPIKAPAALDETPVMLSFRREQTSQDDLLRVHEAVTRCPGMRPLRIEFVDGDGRRLRLAPGPQFRVNFTEELRERLAPWLAGK